MSIIICSTEPYCGTTMLVKYISVEHSLLYQQYAQCTILIMGSTLPVYIYVVMNKMAMYDLRIYILNEYVIMLLTDLVCNLTMHIKNKLVKCCLLYLTHTHTYIYNVILIMYILHTGCNVRNDNSPFSCFSHPQKQIHKNIHTNIVYKHAGTYFCTIHYL